MLGGALCRKWPGKAFLIRGHLCRGDKIWRRSGEEASRPGNSKCKGPEVGGNGLGQVKGIMEAAANGAGREWEARSEANGPQAQGDSGFSSESGGSHWRRLNR